MNKWIVKIQRDALKRVIKEKILFICLDKLIVVGNDHANWLFYLQFSIYYPVPSFVHNKAQSFEFFTLYSFNYIFSYKLNDVFFQF